MIKKISLTEILLVVIGLLVCYQLYLNHKLKNIQENNLAIQIKSNQDIAARIDSLTTTRKDTLTIIKQNILLQEKKKEEVKNEVANTDSINGVIANYYRFRPSHADR